MTNSIDPKKYLDNAELLYSEADVGVAINQLAKQLNKDYIDDLPIVLCVMGGAVVFTGLLLPKLAFPLEFDYVQATRYRGDIVGEKLRWLVKPSDNVTNRKVLILDDILDEGITMKAIADECKSLGASEIKIAVLANKVLDINKPIHADYIGVHVENRYIFGCGMDIYGWWRNTKAIYALKIT